MTVTVETPVTDHPPSAPAAARFQAKKLSAVKSSPGPDRSRTRADLPTTRAPSPTAARTIRSVRAWPLLILALPASVAVWSGWVGIGTMTGFGQVHLLPGIWNSFHLNTAVTLPIGVEAYAAYALHAWLSASSTVSPRTRRFACWSAIGSLLLGMAGQIAYHLQVQAHITRAPWIVTTAVSCLPVLVLGMGAALAHLIRSDAHAIGHAGLSEPAGPGPPGDRYYCGQAYKSCLSPTIPASQIAEAEAAAACLTAAGQRISRRTLRAAGVHASNANLGKLASRLSSASPAASQSLETSLACSLPR